MQAACPDSMQRSVHSCGVCVCTVAECAQLRSVHSCGVCAQLQSVHSCGVCAQLRSVHSCRVCTIAECVHSCGVQYLTLNQTTHTICHANRALIFLHLQPYTQLSSHCNSFTHRSRMNLFMDPRMHTYVYIYAHISSTSCLDTTRHDDCGAGRACAVGGLWGGGECYRSHLTCITSVNHNIIGYYICHR